jgi:23S rRNA (pseudouridine1915-N3)-methyltransferase
LKIKFLGIGKTKHKYLIDGIERYKKLLNPYVTVEEIYLKEDADKADPVDSESDKLIRNIPSGYCSVLLDVNGKSIKSEDFAEIIRSKRDSSVPGIVFIIGGSDGVNGKLKDISDYRISFSSLTLTHQMVRLILAEQIYRSYCIINNKKYHK